MPSSNKRGKAIKAELLCKVEKTRCPVMAARKVICAVSGSRISPTKITSGSWRNKARIPAAKSSFTASASEVWRRRGSGYSTGSSKVMMLSCSASKVCNMEYRLVVLPLPVGPVTISKPSGRCTSWRRLATCAGGSPKAGSGTMPLSCSNSRSTRFSPCSVGKLATRRSSLRPKHDTLNCPSCAARVSAIFIPASTLSRTTIPAHHVCGITAICCKHPSSRRRKRTKPASGSR